MFYTLTVGLTMSDGITKFSHKCWKLQFIIDIPISGPTKNILDNLSKSCSPAFYLRVVHSFLLWCCQLTCLYTSMIIITTTEEANITLKPFCSANAVMVPLLSLVVLVASNTWRKNETHTITQYSHRLPEALHCNPYTNTHWDITAFHGGIIPP